MTDSTQNTNELDTAPSAPEADPHSRRDFLRGLGRWSKIAIGVAVFGGLASAQSSAQAVTWINTRGGWNNGGGSWINRGGGGSWINRGGGGGWVNRRGGGGTGWINRR